MNQIVCGGYHTALVSYDNQIKMIGYNKFGQCNVPDLKDCSVIQAACGDNHTALLLSDGNVQVFGCNKQGQSIIPVKLYDIKTKKMNLDLKAELNGRYVKQIACGDEHTAILFSDGYVKSFGTPRPGRTSLSNPSWDEDILRGRKVEQLACGKDHTIYLFKNGDVHYFGKDTKEINHSTIGYDPFNLRQKRLKAVGVKSGSDFVAVLCSDASVIYYGTYYGFRVKELEYVDPLTGFYCYSPGYGIKKSSDIYKKRVKQIACGGKHSALILEDGNLALIGLCPKADDYHMSDIGGRKVIQVSCGKEHTALMLDDGTVKLFGDNKFGQCDVRELNKY